MKKRAMVHSKVEPASPSASCSSDEEKRPIRPVERQLMKEWLLELLEDGKVSTLAWTDKDKGEFKVGWCHASRQNWNPTHADLFSMYAKHTGRYNGYDKDPKKWKANFRCALNSLKDVEEVKEKSNRKGGNAYKVYRFLDFNQTSNDRTRPVTTRVARIGPTRKRSERVTRRTRISNSSSSEEEYRLPSPSSIVGSPVSPVEVKPWPSPLSGPQSPEPESLPSEVSSQKRNDEKTQSENILTSLPLLPKFEDICPGFDSGIEYGKMHILPKLYCGYTILQGTSNGTPSSLPKVPQRVLSPESPVLNPESPEDSERSQSPDSAMQDVVEYNLYEVEVESSETNSQLLSQLQGIDGVQIIYDNLNESNHGSDVMDPEESTNS